jgi:hypothetical protein
MDLEAELSSCFQCPSCSSSSSSCVVAPQASCSSDESKCLSSSLVAEVMSGSGNDEDSDLEQQDEEEIKIVIRLSRHSGGEY